eukprot:2055481-Prymnesium_polylepis.2
MRRGGGRLDEGRRVEVLAAVGFPPVGRGQYVKSNLRQHERLSGQETDSTKGLPHARRSDRHAPRSRNAHGLSLLESHAGQHENSRELRRRNPCGLTFWAGGRHRKKVHPGIKSGHYDA